MGAPLGVCVNCASPVAVGLYAGGMRVETALAAMIASPTFNVIVLSMVLALLPFYLAAIKIALSLLIILIAIPLICKVLPAEQLQLEQSSITSCLLNPLSSETQQRENFSRSVAGFSQDFLRDLWFIVKMTVPLMFVAGFLGSVFATLVPFDLVEDVPVNLFTLSIAAIVGVIAPVPMAFDVIFAAVLLAGGMPVGFVMVMLFTLGIFSIYSFFIVSRSISVKAASLLTAVIVITSVASGYVADAWHNRQVRQALEILGDVPGFSLISKAHAKAPAIVAGQSPSAYPIVVTSTRFGPPSPAGKKLFTRMEAWHLGIDRPNTFSMTNMFTPHNFTAGSISAADIDNDGDQDVVLALVNGGIRIFLNDGTGHFAPAREKLGMFNKMYVFNAIPVDLNNDGWPDLFITTYLEGNYVVWNQNGHFNADNMSVVKNRKDALLVLTAAFAHIDRDGFLDVVIGNHEGSRMNTLPNERDRNRIIFNDNGKLSGDRFVETDGPPGDTLSILLSDFNQDGKLDLIEANDFNQPDLFYLGEAPGKFRLIRRKDAIIPVSTHTTMSVKMADLDNDGNFEIYLTQIAGMADDLSNRVSFRSWDKSCIDIERANDKKACQHNVDIRTWYRAGGFTLDLSAVYHCRELTGQAEQECREMILRDIAIQTNNQSLCKRIDDDQVRIRTHCFMMFELRKQPRGLSYPDDIPQQKGPNVLLVRQGDGSFLDIAESAGLTISGWSWDVKIFAFDNSELQDIFILNGMWNVQKIMPSKVYMKNQGSLRFKEATAAAGLIDYSIIPSVVAADFDNDGDIDMIGAAINGPMIAFWNNAQNNNAIQIELRDTVGNRFGIGSQIKIFYGAQKERSQIRELQLSGGYTAFDAPIVHFGLGKETSVNRIEVQWSTGEKTITRGPFAAGARYRLER